MYKSTISAIAVFLVSLPWCASAGDYDGSKPMICASMDVMECTPGNSCQEVASDDIDAPQFFRLDLGKKKIVSVRSGSGDRSSKIKHSEKIEGKLILQGAEEGREDIRDGLGWTMSIAEDSGRMILTASGDGAAFVIFGACTPL
jgi:hypothetical protein